jgi:diaminopimelate decarboxylase
MLTQRVAELRAALPDSVKLHYAMKANPMPALVLHMAGWSMASTSPRAAN